MLPAKAKFKKSNWTLPRFQMLKQRDGDAQVSHAEIEFYRVQKVEDQFHKELRRARFDLSSFQGI